MSAIPIQSLKKNEIHVDNDSVDVFFICKLTVPNRLTSLFLVEKLIESVCNHTNRDQVLVSSITLAVSETLCNIIENSFAPGVVSNIEIKVLRTHNILTVVVLDDGKEMPDPVVKQYIDGELNMPSIDSLLEDLPESGWGLNLVIMAISEARYRRVDNRNRLELDFEL